MLLLELSHEFIGGVDHLRGYHGPRGGKAEAPGRKNSGILLLRSKPMFSQKLKREPLSHWALVSECALESFCLQDGSRQYLVFQASQVWSWISQVQGLQQWPWSYQVLQNRFDNIFTSLPVRKYHLNLCRQCFHEYAKDIGFQKLD